MLRVVVVRGMLLIVDIADGKRQNIFSIFRDFVLLLGPRGPDLEPGVEHFFNFWRICFTLWTARGIFVVGGRQKTVILLCFCLLLVPRCWIWPCEQAKTSRKADFGC